MTNHWSASDLSALASNALVSAGLRECVYVTRLVGSDPELALHGGGNTSVKTPACTFLGDEIECLFVKGSGIDMSQAVSADFVALDLGYFRRFRELRRLSDEQMADEFRLHQLLPSARRPSIEALMHAFLPAKFIVHTHPTALLALTNRVDGEMVVTQALGVECGLIPYARVGLDLAQAVVGITEEQPKIRGVLISHHGLVTWGETARDAYDRTIELVTRAEEFLAGRRKSIFASASAPNIDLARTRYRAAALALRGQLVTLTGDPDMPYRRMIVRSLLDNETLGFLGAPNAAEIALTSPLTPDYLIRTKAQPAWIAEPDFDDATTFGQQTSRAVAKYRTEYRSRLEQSGASDLSPDASELSPTVVLVPGLGAVCAGPDADAAGIALDITGQALRVKRLIHETGGTYRGLDAEHLYDMEFRSLQRAKIAGDASRLSGTIALVTGAAGAIGSGICQSLLEQGCHVAASDLAGDALAAMVAELGKRFRGRIIAVTQDVTDAASVAAGFDAIIDAWGGIDLVIVNAGIAHVCALKDMDLEAFRRLERVNIDGTLLVIRESARRFAIQNIGGDIVLVSTKNVFAPGAKFGAYSATKAAAHQLARIASLELAEIGVRVNMVSPDAVFSHGARKSGLWATVGPDRMRARGLDEKGLEEYYQSRNLLKARVTSEHVGRAVLYFATRQTPTTGATIPVDGGLPDATPR